MRRRGDNRSASPASTGEREQPSQVRTHAQQRSWLYQEAKRRLGPGPHTHAAVRASIETIRAGPLPPPAPHRARGHRGGKRRSRAALLSDPVLPVASKPSVPQRAPAIPEPQHAAGVPAGKLRAVRRRVHALEKANRALTAARASDQAELLRLRATASDQDTRLRYLSTAAFDQGARLLALEEAASSSDQDSRLRALKETASSQAEQIKTFDSALGQIKTSASDHEARLRALEKAAYDASDQRPRDAHVVAWRARRLQAKLLRRLEQTTMNFAAARLSMRTGVPMIWASTLDEDMGRPRLRWEFSPSTD